MVSHKLNSENNGRTNGLGEIFYSPQSLSPTSNFAKTLQINLFSHFSSFFAQIHFFATIRDSGKPPFLFRWSKRLKRWCWRFEREKNRAACCCAALPAFTKIRLRWQNRFTFTFIPIHFSSFKSVDDHPLHWETVVLLNNNKQINMIIKLEEKPRYPN